MTRKWRAWLTAAGILAAGLTVQTATPAAAQSTYTFFQFNMAGNMNHRGRTDIIVPAVVQSIAGSRPTAVSLQEVCENQFALIHWQANAAGAGYNGHFAKTVENGCGQDNDYGLGLLLRGVNPEGFQEVQLPGGGEQRKLVCGFTGSAAGHPNRLGVCAAHLSPGDGRPGTPDDKDAQMAWIGKNVLIPFADAGHAWAFMGDTYLEPGEMSEYTGGRFEHAALGDTKTNPACEATSWARAEAIRELVQEPEPNWHTYRWVRDCDARALTRQTDYVMVSKNRLIDSSGDPTSTRWSDHLPVRATAVFR